MAWQEFKTLQAASSEHVAKCFGLYHVDPTSCAAEGNPAVQSMQAILHGSFGSKRSKTSTRSTKSTKIGSSSSPEPQPGFEKPQLCALLMERFDCSLHDLTFVNLTEPEVTSFARVRRLCILYFGFHFLAGSKPRLPRTISKILARARQHLRVMLYFGALPIFILFKSFTGM